MHFCCGHISENHPLRSIRHSYRERKKKPPLLKHSPTFCLKEYKWSFALVNIEVASQNRLHGKTSCKSTGTYADSATALQPSAWHCVSLHGAAKTALNHWGMDSTRPLKVPCGIRHRDFRIRSFKSCKLQVGPQWIRLVFFQHMQARKVFPEAEHHAASALCMGSSCRASCCCSLSPRSFTWCKKKNEIL